MTEFGSTGRVIESAIESAIERAAANVAALLRSVDLRAVRHVDDRQLVHLAQLGGEMERLVGALAIAVAGEVAERSRPSLGFAGLASRHGKNTPAQLIEQLARVSNAVATRRVRLAEAVRSDRELSGWERPPRFPVLATALIAGQVNGDAAAVIVRCLDQARTTASDENLAAAERMLVEFAAIESADHVAVLARMMRERLDPDGVHPREEETRTRRGIRLGREHHGVTPISGGLAPEFAALLKAEFDAANSPGATPRFLPLDNTPTLGNPHPATEVVTDDSGIESLRIADDRTRDQRQHDVLFGVVKAGLRATGSEPGALRSTADVTITIGMNDLTTGIGHGYLEGIDEPVSAETVERLLCDATWRKALLGANGEPLALGKTQYRFSTAQKRAILLRDGDRCVMCDAPASWGDFHHVVPYNAGGGHGRTDVANGVNLCSRDHALFHNSNWKIRIRDGVPEIRPPREIDWTERWRPVGKNHLRRLYSATR